MENEYYRPTYSHIGGETSFFNTAFVSGYVDEVPSNSEGERNGYTQQDDVLCFASAVPLPVSAYSHHFLEIGMAIISFISSLFAGSLSKRQAG